MRIAVAAGLIALACYALLKAAWGMGSDVGIVDTEEFDAVFGSLTAVQVWLATWGTVVLAVVGGVLLVAVVAEERTFLGRPPLQDAVRGLAWAVVVLLGGFALVALFATVTGSGPSPFATWVSYLTYGSFLVYALALGLVCRSTRRPRRRSYSC